MKNLNDLLSFLHEKRIDFILIGGYAGVVHGSTQVTRDIDICALLTPMHIRELRERLKDINPIHRMNPSFKPSFLTYPKDISNVRNIYLETDLGVLDIVSDVSGIGGFEELKKRAVKITIFGKVCRVISIEDLIRAKESLGRDKDRIAAAELREILKRIKNKS